MSARRVAKLLGLSSVEAGLLLARARRRLGTRGLAVRTVAFSIATSPLRRLLPRRLCEAAIRPLVYALIPGPTENLLYTRVSAPRAAEEQSGGDG
jgi:hypothetical protein